MSTHACMACVAGMRARWRKPQRPACVVLSVPHSQNIHGMEHLEVAHTFRVRHAICALQPVHVQWRHLDTSQRPGGFEYLCIHLRHAQQMHHDEGTISWTYHPETVFTSHGRAVLGDITHKHSELLNHSVTDHHLANALRVMRPQKSLKRPCHRSAPHTKIIASCQLSQCLLHQWVLCP
jgi:hypothetical protein